MKVKVNRKTYDADSWKTYGDLGIFEIVEGDRAILIPLARIRKIEVPVIRHPVADVEAPEEIHEFS